VNLIWQVSEADVARKVWLGKLSNKYTQNMCTVYMFKSRSLRDWQLAGSQCHEQLGHGWVGVDGWDTCVMGKSCQRLQGQSRGVAVMLQADR